MDFSEYETSQGGIWRISGWAHYRLLHIAGRITRSGRRMRLHLPAGWPWAAELVVAFGRLRALAAPAA